MSTIKLKDSYKADVIPKLMKKFGYKNVMQVPRLEKIVISRGIGQAVNDKQALEEGFEELMLISGQRPIKTNAKKSISNFKLREGYPIGAKVTLRRNRMFDFMYRFTNIELPLVPDFRGIKPQGDGRGNFSLGLKDQMIFYEINLDRVKFTNGMNIVFVTSAKTDNEGLELLRLLGVPFKKDEKSKNVTEESKDVN